MGVYEDAMKEIADIQDPKLKAKLQGIIEETLKDEGESIGTSSPNKKGASDSHRDKNWEKNNADKDKKK